MYPKFHIHSFYELYATWLGRHGSTLFLGCDTKSGPLNHASTPQVWWFWADTPANLDFVPVPTDADRYPRKREGKLVKRTATCPNPQQQLSMGSSDSLKAQICLVTMIFHPGHGCIIALDSMTPSNVIQYHIPISSLLGCTCPALKKTMTNFRVRSQFSYCKHVY